MANDLPDEWPPYLNRGRYTKHMHAVGVLIANWATVEGAYQALFQHLFFWNFQLGLRSFELLGNQGRWELLNEIGPQAAPEFAEHIHHFLKCAAICKENRNAVAHADYQNGPSDEIIRLLKGRNKDRTALRDYHFSVESIRQMADETHGTAMYGMLIFAHLEMKRTAPDGTIPRPDGPPLFVRLPSLQKPPVPKKWDLHSLRDQ